MVVGVRPWDGGGRAGGLGVHVRVCTHVCGHVKCGECWPAEPHDRVACNDAASRTHGDSAAASAREGAGVATNSLDSLSETNNSAERSLSSPSSRVADRRS